MTQHGQTTILSGAAVNQLWAAWPDNMLLDLTLCDLRLDLKGRFLTEQIARLYAELASRQLVFRPHFWLSDK